jgi:hypothetical protein
VLFASIGSLNRLPACGDKFLVVSRGTRYQRAPISRTPAAILIYRNPASDLPIALAGVLLDETLRKAGYRPTVVITSADYEEALSRGGWDLVLVGIADAPSASRRVQSNSGVLPVVVNPTAAELQQTKKLYPVVLKAPAKSEALLDAVDQALASSHKAQAKESKPAI